MTADGESQWNRLIPLLVSGRTNVPQRGSGTKNIQCHESRHRPGKNLARIDDGIVIGSLGATGFEFNLEHLKTDGILPVVPQSQPLMHRKRIRLFDGVAACENTADVHLLVGRGGSTFKTLADRFIVFILDEFAAIGEFGEQVI